jgi:hypothetical protein
VFLEFRGADAFLNSGDLLFKPNIDQKIREVTLRINYHCSLNISTFVARNWMAYILAVRPVVYTTFCNAMSALTIAAMIQDWTNWPIDRELLQL